MLNGFTDSLIPFVANKIDTELLWNDGNINSSVNEIRNRCSYFIQKNNELKIYNGDILNNNEKVFWAERYGGEYISRNGGGGRCGFDGRWQIKGIGLNPLVGLGQHYDGSLPTECALLEILWSKFFEVFLPYGAVSAKMALLTNYNLDYKPKSIIYRKSMIIRDFCIRPAHFCKATYFKPAFKYEDDFKSNHDVMINTISHIDEYLPKPGFLTENDWHNLSHREKCHFGLAELTFRFAVQLSKCRAHHFILMTSISNCEINGRLLDFNSILNLAPELRKGKIEDLALFNKMESEHLNILNGLLEITYTLSKFIFDDTFYSETASVIENTFKVNYKTNLNIENLSKCGLDKEYIIKIVDSNLFNDISLDLQKLIDLQQGVISYKLGSCTDHIHPLKIILNNILDNEISGTNKIDHLHEVKKQLLERFTIKFKKLLDDYVIYKKNFLKIDKTNVIFDMKSKINTIFSDKSFMDRDIICNTINKKLLSAYQENNLRIFTEWFYLYQKNFTTKAIDALTTR